MKFSPIPFVLTILMLAVCQHVRAQEWRKVTTKTNGTKIEMPPMYMTRDNWHSHCQKKPKAIQSPGLQEMMMRR